MHALSRTGERHLLIPLDLDVKRTSGVKEACSISLVVIRTRESVSVVDEKLYIYSMVTKKH